MPLMIGQSRCGEGSGIEESQRGGGIPPLVWPWLGTLAFNLGLGGTGNFEKRTFIT